MGIESAPLGVELAPPPCRARGSLWLVAAGFGLAAAGMAVMVWAQRGAMRAVEDAPFGDALVLVGAERPVENARAARARRLPAELVPKPAFIEALEEEPRGLELIEELGLDRVETVVALELTPEEWAALTGAGRAPDMSKAEVLAGSMARVRDSFELDGVRFEVTGSIREGAAGFTFGYAAPLNGVTAPCFSDEAGGEAAWLMREQDLDAIEKARDDAARRWKSVFPLIRARPEHSGARTAGILFVCAGAALLHFWLALRLGRGRARRYVPFLGAVAERPCLFWSLHGLLYAVWLTGMAVGAAYPFAHMLSVAAVQEVFSTGGLSYIGEAYESGNVLRAAWATFFNNCLLQTYGLAMLPSLVIPAWGVLKNAASIGLAGFVLAPVWVDTSGKFTLHTITIALELEAYILSCVAVCLPLARFIDAVRSGLRAKEDLGGALALGLTNYVRTLPALFGAMIPVGIILAIAALYEAVTLIH